MSGSTSGLLLAREAAEYLAISERLLWTLTRSGSVPVVRIGRAVRYDPADLRAWVETRKSCQGAAAPVDEAPAASDQEK